MRILELEPQGDWQGVCILSGGSIRSQDSLNCHVAFTFPPCWFSGGSFTVGINGWERPLQSGYFLA